MPAVSTPPAAPPNPAPPLVPMTRYRLLTGFHVEMDPDPKSQGKVIATNEVFESPNNWYVEKWPEKFAYAENPADGASGFMWNPAKETIEEFTARMKQAAMPSPQQLAEAKNRPQTNELDTIAAMTVEELRRYAEEEEIDIKKVRKGMPGERDELMKIVLGVVQAPK